MPHTFVDGTECEHPCACNCVDLIAADKQKAVDLLKWIRATVGKCRYGHVHARIETLLQEIDHGGKA